jgi:hypothetical protein
VEDFRQDADQNYFGTTVVHPVGLTVLIALCVLMLFIPRRWAFLPLLVLACFIAPAQRIMVGGLNWDFPRILVLAGWLRLVVRGEIRKLQSSALDRCVIWFAISGTLVYFALYQTWDSFKYRLGWGYDVVAFYFFLRQVFHRDMDIRRVANSFSLLAVPVAAFFALEFFTHRNVFSVFGGIPELTWIRDGRLRCQGAFAHPIIAGVFWGSLVPVIASGWWSSRVVDRAIAWVGLLGATVIVLTSNSSTSVAALATALVAMLAFPLRSVMRPLRWAAVVTLFALHMVMKAPVWQLVGRFSAYDSSTGYHRFLVIDGAIRHFNEWWLLGTESTASWEAEDVTNEYVLVGVEGGLLSLVFFVAIIALAFREVGRAWRRTPGDRAQVWMAWLLGATLFVHCSNFIGVSYFGQARMLWQLGLAMIGSLASCGPAAAQQVVVRVTRTPVAAPVRSARGSAVRTAGTSPEPPPLPGATGADPAT